MDIRDNAQSEHMCVVLLAAVAGVSAYLVALHAAESHVGYVLHKQLLHLAARAEGL